MTWWLSMALLLPLLAFIPFFTPPEWWFSLHDDSHIAKTANVILWLEMRLGEWECLSGAALLDLSQHPRT
jgi:hypothetical protein